MHIVDSFFAFIRWDDLHEPNNHTSGLLSQFSVVIWAWGILV